MQARSAYILIGLLLGGMVFGPFAVATDGTNGTSGPAMLDYDTDQLFDSQDPPHTIVFPDIGQTITLTGHGTATVTGGVGNMLYATDGIYFVVPDTVTVTATETGTFSATATGTGTATGTATGTLTDTEDRLNLTWTDTGTGTRTVTWTLTAAPTVSMTGTASGTSTITGSVTGTVTASATETITGTATSSATDTATCTRTGTSTFTGTGTDSCGSALGCTVTRECTGTDTITATNTATAELTATATYEGDTSTETSTDTVTASSVNISDDPTIGQIPHVLVLPNATHTVTDTTTITETDIGSTTPAPGEMPIAETDGKINLGWLPVVISGSSLYFDDSVAPYTGYQALLTTISTDAEEVDQVTIDSGDGETLIEEYATLPDFPGSPVWRGGGWKFRMWRRVSITSGYTNLVMRVFRRDNVGTETQLFYVSSGDINDTSVALEETETTRPDDTGASDDVLVVKVYAITTSAAAVTVYFTHNGTDHFSSIDTPLSSAPISSAYPTGSGTAQYVPRWSGAHTLEDSPIYSTTDSKIGLGTTDPSTSLHIVGSGTSNSLFRVNSLEFQPYALNNAWFGENTYFNGSSFKYRENGTAGMFYFYGDEGQFRFATTGTAGNDLPGTYGYTQFKVNADGTVALGSNSCTSAPGNYTSCTIVADGSGITFNQDIVSELAVTRAATADSIVKFNSLEIQPYAVNNSWFGDNTYFNGSAFKYRANGYAGIFYFYNGEGQFRFASSGSAGGDLPGTYGYVQLKINNDGTVAMGGNDCSNAPGNYSNCMLVADGTDVTVAGPVAATNVVQGAGGIVFKSGTTTSTTTSTSLLTTDTLVISSTGTATSTFVVQTPHGTKAWTTTGTNTLTYADIYSTFVVNAPEATKTWTDTAVNVLANTDIGRTTPTASKIPIADGSGTLDSWVSGAQMIGQYDAANGSAVSSAYGPTWTDVVSLTIGATTTSVYATAGVSVEGREGGGDSAKMFCKLRLVLGSTDIGHYATTEVKDDTGVTYTGHLSVAAAFSTTPGSPHTLTAQVQPTGTSTRCYVEAYLGHIAVQEWK